MQKFNQELDDLNKIVIFGNSGSGKLTLAEELSDSDGLDHFDLDSVAWLSTSPPERKPIEKSILEIDEFKKSKNSWVIEGCYADLLETVITEASEIIFLNLPVDACISNAKNRPWEPHKYASKLEQDGKLEMLIGWIAQYAERKDEFSRSSHEKLFNDYRGKKTMYINNESIGRINPTPPC